MIFKVNKKMVMKEMENDFEWLQEHYKELREKYPEKVVVILDKKVIDIGDTIQEAEQSAKPFIKLDKKPLFGRIRKKGAMILYVACFSLRNDIPENILGREELISNFKTTFLRYKFILEPEYNE